MPAKCDELNVAVDALVAGEHTWADMDLADRKDLLERLAHNIDRHAQKWVETACAIKGLRPDSQAVGEEWITGPYALLGAVEALAETLESIERGRSPVDGYTFVAAPDDRVAVEVLPHTVFDRLILNGYTAQVWMTPGTSSEEVTAAAGLAQLNPTRTGGIGLVLGAGNILSIAPLDALYELFAHNRVVLLKLNPVTDSMRPVLEKVFADFIETGLIRIITGGASVGAAAIEHPDIAHVHITGSTKSFDAIVFGAGAGGEERRMRGEPVLEKPITGELGGVSPTIVVPGEWTTADLRFQAEHIVTQRLHNDGCNCVAAQVVVISDDWPQKSEFLAEVRDAFFRAPHRPPWYPGAEDRTGSATTDHPGAERIGHRVLIEVPAVDAPIFTEEYFGPVLGITALPGSTENFLGAAVDFANEKLTGTLGANIIVDPVTERRLGADLPGAVAGLRYGTVGINAWTAVGYLTARASWGAYPGHTLEDVQSGIGIVHNALLLDHVERTVVRGPFREFPRSLLTGKASLSPRPPWFVTNRTARRTGELLTRFSANPGWRRLPALFASALRG